MKAYVLHGVNKLQYDEVEEPACPKDWAIVKVKAAGICSSDIARVFTNGTYHFPTIPGHEFAGIVESVGSDTDIKLIGKHVGVFPLIPCGNCEQCKAKHFEMCVHYDYVGSRRDGGFAEYVAVPVWNLILLPEDLSFKSAAMLEPLSVALHAIKIANIEGSQSVGVIGTGMIGISAAQWAKRMGASEVVIIGRNEEKRKLVESVDLNYINQKTFDGSFSYDIVIEAVGAPSSVDLSINLTTPGGTLVLMGNPSNDIVLSQNTYWRILRKQLTLKGTWNSFYDNQSPSDWTEVVEALRKHKIKIEHLISHCFKQEHLQDGLKLMFEHKEPYCKVMTTWNE